MKTRTQNLVWTLAIIVAAVLSASPFRSHEAVERDVASIENFAWVNGYELANGRPDFQAMYSNAFQDPLSPYNPKLLESYGLYLQNNISRTPRINNWEQVVNMSPSAFGQHLNDLMDLTGVQMDQNRQIWTAGQGIANQQAQQHLNVFLNSDNYVGGQASRYSAWGASDRAFRNPARVTVPGSQQAPQAESPTKPIHSAPVANAVGFTPTNINATAPAEEPVVEQQSGI